LSWTDIHSHILPGFDDGAESNEEFFQMARAAVRGGTSLMAATPHYDCEGPSFEPAEIAAAVAEHNLLLRDNGIPLVLVQGMEVRINAGLFDRVTGGGGLEGMRLGEAGRYMLVDLQLSDMPVATPDILFQVMLRGITPVLAHPERNRYLVEHPSVPRELVERGTVLQVNSGSLEGTYGRDARRAARLMLKEGIATLVASDSHGVRGRSPDMSVAVRLLDRLLGKGASELLMGVNPRKVLEGEEL
jgi:protein-tyrosine phosphatase